LLAPLNVPSLLGEDASNLYSENQYHLLALMMKDNVIRLDWSDEILAKTVLTHAGKLGPGAADTVPSSDNASNNTGTPLAKSAA